MGDDEYQLSKQMGYSHAEFRRTLPAAVSPFRIREKGDDFELSDSAGHAVRIELGPEGMRQIASLQIPTTAVDFHFQNFSSEERKHFMDRFNRYFQRGGG
ncbi:MAG: hypothetical protein U9Q71_03940 [Pseudomonadota bacterium]|nr:hypothetical protein [Pseudomonadota bacterium]